MLARYACVGLSRYQLEGSLAHDVMLRKIHCCFGRKEMFVVYFGIKN
jgi:hypothetical protein